MVLGLAEFSLDSSTFCQPARQLLAKPPEAFALVEAFQELSLNCLLIIYINEENKFSKKQEKLRRLCSKKMQLYVRIRGFD